MGARKSTLQLVMTFSFSLSFSCSIVMIEQEKDREKEKVGGRQAKLNEKNGDRDLGLEIKKKEAFLCWKNKKIL